MSLESIFAPFMGPIGKAALYFPFVACLFALPFALWHYRRHGRLHPFRALLGYSFVFYAIVVVFLVIFPLPKLPSHSADPAAWEALYGKYRHPEFNPIVIFLDIARAPGAAKMLRALFQAVFNGLLFLPLGLYLVYGFGRKAWQAVLVGAGASLLMEICQLTGDFGIYPGPYRLFDTGDILMNGLGCLAGASLAVTLMRTKRLPALADLAGPQTPWVGPLRRGFALLADLFAYGAIAVFLVSLSDLVHVRLDPGQSIIASGSAILVFILVPALTGGSGIGHGLTLTRIEGRDGGRAGTWRILARQSSLWLAPALAYLGVNLLPRGGHFDVAAGILILAWLGFLAVHALGSATAPDKRGLADRLSGTSIRNTWKPQD
jgi:glycopeptide antibiotics resistance protein